MHFADKVSSLPCDEWRGEDVIYSADHVYAYAEKNQIDEVVFDSIGVGAGVKAQFNRKSQKIRALGTHLQRQMA